MAKNLILGSDWWTDCDDAVAVRLCVRAHKAGKIRLLGINLDACDKDSIPSLDAFLTHEGLADLPIGIDRDATDASVTLTYQKRLAAMSGQWRQNEDVPDGVSLYRKLLSQAEGKVDIAEIGFEQVLSQLLHSEADEYSKLNGRELIAEKVGTLWLMAGKWDEDGGKEYNVVNNTVTREAASDVCANWPTPIVYLGFEVGVSVITGGDILPENDILRQAMVDHGAVKGRNSWDPMLVELAMSKDAEKAGYDLVRGYADIDPVSGENHFRLDPEGPHSYVVKRLADKEYAQRINCAIGY